MNNEKQTAEEISVKNNKFLSWLDNYWYHYKWTTIIVAFAVIVFSICIIQSCTNQRTDVLVTYAGPVYLQADQNASIDSALNKGLGKISDDNSLAIGFKAYYVLTTEQIEELQKQTDSDGHPKTYVDTAFNGQEMESLESQLMAGNGSIVLIDKDMYAMFFKNGTTERLQPLSDVLGEKPANAVDSYAVRLGDTEIYQNSPDLQRLPKDTLVCLHKKLGQKDYDKQIEIFKKLTQSANGGN